MWYEYSNVNSVLNLNCCCNAGLSETYIIIQIHIMMKLYAVVVLLVTVTYSVAKPLEEPMCVKIDECSCIT